MTELNGNLSNKLTEKELMKIKNYLEFTKKFITNYDFI